MHMISNDDNEILLRCSCGDRGAHIAWLIYDPIWGGPRPANLRAEDDDWYLFTSLDLNYGFWHRVWTALRYIIKPRSLRYYGYSELVLKNQDIEMLSNFILRKLDAISKREQPQACSGE